MVKKGQEPLSERNTSLFQSPRVLIVIDEDPMILSQVNLSRTTPNILPFWPSIPITFSPFSHFSPELDGFSNIHGRSKSPVDPLRFAQWIPGDLQLAGAESKLCAWRNDSRVWLEWDGAPWLKNLKLGNRTKMDDSLQLKSAKFPAWFPGEKHMGFLWMFRLWKNQWWLS